MGNQQAKTCGICSKQTKKTKECQKCQKLACEQCYDFPILIEQQDKQFQLNKVKYSTACIVCFQGIVTIDFNTNYEILGDNNQKQVILIHGAGSCRKMFIPHARKLVELGYRCILIDLPGHGGRLKQDLTAQNCLKSIIEAKNLCKSKDITIIGASLGGYILMDCLGRQQNLCTRAIIMMAGQNVGVGRSVPASIGLWAMQKAINYFSQADIAQKFLKAASGNPNLDGELIKQLSKGGTYFKHVDGNIKVLKQSNPRSSLQKASNVKCLFINGSKDHRDSEQIWLDSAAKGSKLIVYEGADHFYSHDKRFFAKLIEDINQFIKNN